MSIGKAQLLQPIKMGAWNLRNRIAMAPMTRCFADNETGVVGPDVVEYYRKRAADGVGLIISEGITISPRAKGTIGLPGLYTEDQIQSWKKVTDAVHQVGGTIIAQIWHVGRLSHHEVAGGLPPQAPSPIPANGHVHRLGKPYDTPEEMSAADIEEVIQQYAAAAHNAITAGFDGVEIHGAHGYLIDQFNSDISNHRQDQYGGDLRQRLTFMREVSKAVIAEIGADRTIMRFSALKDDVRNYMWEDPDTAIRTFVEAFKESGLTMIHPSTMDFSQVIADGLTLHELVRTYWDGIIIGVGNLNPEIAEQAVQTGTIDTAAFGRPFLANPDLVSRVSQGEAFIAFDASKHFHVLV
ncbi:alkene reductase [Paenibacillus arenosi]|uniref:Alkene reductase n=1 Tax=Paenibacillus arenosi TaxID=2774142 RepID=A0ABR9B454_9BACL|nr:alkene reductase [Paenibacillus arenosi]MBD8501135.1 alkene reductase [Paenibacillus arenosi]